MTAIDVHAHVLTSTAGRSVSEGSAQDAVAGYFGRTERPTLPEMAAFYRERRMACVAFTVDDASFSGEEPPVSNEEVAELAAQYSDTVIPFASVDPHRGRAGVRLARRLIEDYGVRGFKFHPSQQVFVPSDRLAYPLYEVIAEHRLPALFHTGQTGVGAGQPGGGGIRLEYANPIYLDDVAADFPEMPIILAHPSFPWQEQALSVASHKPQVYIDLSGWSPKYFPPILVQYANTLLRHKVLFGSDFPVMSPDRWLADFEQLPIKPEVRPLILKENAVKLLGLG
ncbi:MAG: amidohydrolase [Candidatus Dormibacteraeota bacterium]|nr:amidohydrolase [Candidatus Dormibacteraeota bacterium]